MIQKIIESGYLAPESRVVIPEISDAHSEFRQITEDVHGEMNYALRMLGPDFAGRRNLWKELETKAGNEVKLNEVLAEEDRRIGEQPVIDLHIDMA